MHPETAQPEQAQALYALEQACFTSDCISLRQYRYLLSRSSAVIRYIPHAENNALIVAASVLLRRKNSTLLRLYSLAVHPEQRGKGFAALLLKDCEKIACHYHARCLQAETRQDNIPIHSLLSAHGWLQTDIRQAYYQDGMDAQCWKKHIQT